MREGPAHGHDGLEGLGPVAGRRRGRQPVQERQHLAGDLVVLGGLVAQERQHPQLGGAPLVDPAEHRAEVRQQAPDHVGPPRGVAVEVVGGEELHARRRVLAQAQKELRAVLLAEVPRQHLAPEGLHVGPGAVGDADQDLGGEVARLEPVAEEPERPRAGVVPPGVEGAHRAGHVGLDPLHALLEHPLRRLAHRGHVVAQQPRQVVHAEAIGQVAALAQQLAPEVLRLHAPGVQEP